MLKLLVALPSYEEQKRIVSIIEELMPYIDRYEKSWTKLDKFNKRFPSDMRKSILQLAIQGKLVEQREEEGTAEELYQQIQEEKQRLIDEGRIKKEKVLPEITEDEIPFEIPKSWKWVRLGSLGEYKKGPFGSALTKSMFVPKTSDAIKVYEQKNAIKKIVQGIKDGEKYQVLLGVTGSGKTFTMANIIANLQIPTLIMTHNKSLAAQLYSEFKGFFPQNHVEYFISYYDYYQPEAYIPRQDLFIEKDSSINDELERLRLSATASLLSFDDVITIASVSANYGLGDPKPKR